MTEFFFNKYLWEAKRFAICTQERLQEGEKHSFYSRMSRILFAAKHSWTWWGLGHEKEEKSASNDNFI